MLIEHLCSSGTVPQLLQFVARLYEQHSRHAGAMEIAREDERPETRMLTADKDDINRFSRLLTARNQARETLARREKLRALHEDAGEELLLLDDGERVQYNVGDAFFYDAKDAVEGRVEETAARIAGEIEALKAGIAETGGEIAALKAKLYAKFGKSINLEEGGED